MDSAIFVYRKALHLPQQWLNLQPEVILSLPVWIFRYSYFLPWRLKAPLMWLSDCYTPKRTPSLPAAKSASWLATLESLLEQPHFQQEVYIFPLERSIFIFDVLAVRVSVCSYVLPEKSPLAGPLVLCCNGVR